MTRHCGLGQWALSWWADALGSTKQRFSSKKAGEGGISKGGAAGARQKIGLVIRLVAGMSSSPTLARAARVWQGPYPSSALPKLLREGSEPSSACILTGSATKTGEGSSLGLTCMGQTGLP